MMLPGGAAIPAVTADRIRIAEATGAARRRDRQRTAHAGEDHDARRRFENALRVLLAISGSTNAIVHLTAMAGRLGIALDLEAFDRIGRETPVLVDLKPSGQHYMEDLYRVGGLTTILREIKPLLTLDALTITGRTLGAEIDAAPTTIKQDVVRPFNEPDHSAKAAWRCCAAISRPAARSSSSRRRPRN